MLLHNVLLLTVNKNYEPGGDLYEAVRFAWRVDKAKAEAVDYVLPVYYGTIMGAFKVTDWLPATHKYFPKRTNTSKSNRFGFVARESHPNVWDYYCGMQVPSWIKRTQNPVRYVEIEEID